MKNKISLFDSARRITALMQSLGYEHEDKYPRSHGKSRMYFVKDHNMFCLVQTDDVVCATYGPYDGVTMTTIGLYEPLEASSENEFLVLLESKVKGAEIRIRYWGDIHAA